MEGFFWGKKDTVLDLPTLYDTPALGKEAVKKRLEDLRYKEIGNGKKYIFMPVICAPVIWTRWKARLGTMAGLGDRGKGSARGIERTAL